MPNKPKILFDLKALFHAKDPGQLIRDAMPKRKKSIKSDLADRKAGIDPSTPVTPIWTRKSLVLPVLEIECLSCGNKVQAPAGPVLIKSTNPRKGTQLRPAAPGTYSPDTDASLPRELYVKYEAVSDCPKCFDICNYLYEAVNGKDALPPNVIQLRLFQ